ncbi:hypothetical protein A5699_22465 [Mycobacterium sp. E802]|uniref:hypothetical protein n=1 Tax=Mycobacterium sp. E802 TaxID=1834152 RepID=UPI0007FE7482|nr:hypothetical protein [Mycobacterium sp. E802]OBG85995.1 hypothetical protein A5699_22465 [Mycobacterium sp. E802]
MNGSTPRVPSDGPIPAELLADLQAGLLDDATAAQVRRRVRTDPQAGPEAREILSALDRVRREVRALGTDSASAPEVPEEVSARLSEALRAAPGPAGTRRWKVLAAATGAAAAVVAIVIGSLMLLRPPATTTSTLTSVGRISVSPPRTDIGLPESQILGLLSAPADLGPLADPQHRAACLRALGYPPGVQILGARPHDVAGRRGVLMLLPAADGPPSAAVALVVAADCDGGRAGLLARTVLNRPVRSP